MQRRVWYTPTTELSFTPVFDHEAIAYDCTSLWIGKEKLFGLGTGENNSKAALLTPDSDL